MAKPIQYFKVKKKKGLVLKLKLQYFGHLMQRDDPLEKILMLGKTRQEEKGMTEDDKVGWHH